MKLLDSALHGVKEIQDIATPTAEISIKVKYKKNILVFLKVVKMK